jgi:NAD-dependent dihydropyrimidine dehydrogenase PreA subunit
MAGYKVKVGDCDPKGCGYRCQEICPTGVFLAMPRKKLKDHSIEPDYRIVPRFAYFCNGCMDCVTACPEAAIKVSGPSGD